MLQQSLCAYIEDNTKNIQLVGTFIISFMISIGYIPHMFLNIYVLYCVMNYTAHFLGNNRADNPAILIDILGQWVVTSRFIIVEYILGLLLENIFGVMYPLLKIITYIALLGNDKISASYCMVFIVILFNECEKYINRMRSHIQTCAIHFRVNSKVDAKTYIYNFITNYNNIEKFKVTDNVNNGVNKTEEANTHTTKIEKNDNSNNSNECSETNEKIRNDFANDPNDVDGVDEYNETNDVVNTETEDDKVSINSADGTDSTNSTNSTNSTDNTDNTDNANNSTEFNETDDNATETTECSSSDGTCEVDKTE